MSICQQIQFGYIFAMFEKNKFKLCHQVKSMFL
jgi:hypothetical protein